MMTNYQFEEMIRNINKPKQADLIIEERKNGFVTYFKSNKSRIGIGQTEEEALYNLKVAIDAAIKEK